MSGNLLYALGSLGTWIGLIAILYALLQAVRIGVSRRSDGWAGVAAYALVGSVLMLAAARLPNVSNPRGTQADFYLPLIWFVLPFSGWASIACAGMAILRLIQSATELSPPSRNARLRAAGIWAVLLGLAMFFAFRSTEKVEVLRGNLGLSWPVVAAMLSLLVGGFAAYVAAARFSRARGYATGAVTHIMLLLGSAIFGLPFLWALITSFKEDRDMSAPDGIVWVPKVQETIPFMDAREPMWEGTFKGRSVHGVIAADHGADGVEVEVVDPSSLRGQSFFTQRGQLKEIAKQAPVVSGDLGGQPFTGMVVEELEDGSRRVRFLKPDALKGREQVFKPNDLDPVRSIGLRTQNYSEALDALPEETLGGLVYLKNTLLLVFFSVIGTVVSSSIVAFAFARLKFPGRQGLFYVLLATMMLPGAVTMLPRFLIFRSLGWIDTLYPIWVPAFFASAFNVFLLRQFFMGIPNELEDAAKIDGCAPPRIFWSVMLPLVKPAIAFIAVSAFMGAWNNFIDPLIYLSSPEQMPLAYGLQLFNGQRSGEPGMLMAFTVLSMLPVVAVFLLGQKYIVEGVALTGLGGR